jgi:RHS repeat-associated protein
VNGLGAIATAIFDKADRVISTVDPLANRTSLTYDVAGRQVRSTSPLGKISTSIYNVANQLISTINPLGFRVTYSYDGNGQQVARRDAHNNIVSTVYNQVGQEQARIDSKGVRTTQVYDAAGQRVALIDGNSYRNTFLFDGAGQQIAWLDPLSRRVTHSFDAARREVLRIDGRGNRTSYQFDKADRLIGWFYPDGTRVTQGYDGIDRRTNLQDSTGRTTWIFDATGRVLAMMTPVGQRVSYSYDAVGQRSFMTEPGATRFSYTYDKAGRISRLLNPQGVVITWTYDDAGRITSRQMSNGLRASFTWDDADQLTNLVNMTSGGVTTSTFGYAYDPPGNRTRVVEATGVRVSWAYDSNYRLIQEMRSGSNGFSITYTYDKVGNRLIKIQGGVRTSYLYDAANQLKVQQDNTGTTTYTWDGSGNQFTQTVPSGERTTFTWDFESRLKHAFLRTGARNTMAYDGGNRRVRKEDSGGTLKYVWDEENILLETDQNNITQVLYTLEPSQYGNLTAQFSGGSTKFFLFDGLGSTDRITDQSGTITDRYIYTAFGGIQASVGATTTPYRFVGEKGYYGNTDLEQLTLRARYYSPSNGRFLSVDPIGFSVDINLYRYAINNPTNLIDPSGYQCPQTCCCCVMDAKFDPKRLFLIPLGANKTYGHSFVISSDLVYVKAPKENICRLIWREKSNRFPFSLIKAGARNNKWNDIFNLATMATPFDAWVRNTAKRPCPGKNTVEIKDTPVERITAGFRFVLWAITIKSAPNCDCPKQAKNVVNLFLAQVLKPDGKGGIDKQQFFSDIGKADKTDALREIPF